MSDRPNRILVVDDEPDLVVLLEEHLTQEGFEVLTAGAGMEAISMARSEKPDLILLDVMMPGVSGFDVCNILQDFPETTDIPVIFLTAVAETKRKVMGLNLGADDYITKPFDLHELTARVQAAMRPRLSHQPVSS
ncbi:MAG TPA: response regulator [Chloroflexota bacterium]|nr:response regulator [Chloroflexota bacterium]